MEILAERVAVDGPHGPLLRPTSLLLSSGQVLLVAGEPGAGHTALGLVLTGRMTPSAGRVLLDGSPDARAQRTALAVVDAPGVTAAEDALSVRRVVAEGLALAGRRSGRRAQRRFLADHGSSGAAEDRWDSVPPVDRTRLAAALAAARSGVRGLVLDCPDRHGGAPIDWYRTARGYAADGLAVVVLCSPHSARQLGIRPALLGRLRQPIDIPDSTPPSGGDPATPRSPGGTSVNHHPAAAPAATSSAGDHAVDDRSAAPDQRSGTVGGSATGPRGNGRSATSTEAGS